MKNKSFFCQIMLLIILSLVCVVLTVGIALLAGSYSATLFNFENLNFANMIPVLVFGGFISCIVIGITVLFVARSVFMKLKNHFTENENKNGGKEK